MCNCLFTRTYWISQSNSSISTYLGMLMTMCWGSTCTSEWRGEGIQVAPNMVQMFIGARRAPDPNVSLTAGQLWFSPHHKHPWGLQRDIPYWPINRCSVLTQCLKSVSATLNSCVVFLFLSWFLMFFFVCLHFPRTLTEGCRLKELTDNPVLAGLKLLTLVCTPRWWELLQDPNADGAAI